MFILLKTLKKCLSKNSCIFKLILRLVVIVKRNNNLQFYFVTVISGNSPIFSKCIIFLRVNVLFACGNKKTTQSRGPVHFLVAQPICREYKVKQQAMPDLGGFLTVSKH